MDHSCPVLAREVPAPNLFAAYGPNDYEILLIEQDRTTDVAALVERLRAALPQWRRAGGRLASPGTRATGAPPTRCSRGRTRCLRAGWRAGRPERGARRRGRARRRDAARSRAGRAGRAATINVLILGETGVGKEVLAQIDPPPLAARRQAVPPLNCAA